MAEEQEKTGDAEEPKQKGKLVPLVIGVVLVIGAAAGVVTMTSPSEPVEEKKVELDTLDSIRAEQALEWTVSLASGGSRTMGKLKVSFDYKAEDPIAAKAAIAKGKDKVDSEVLLLLLGKTRATLSTAEGVVQLKLEIQEILDKAFFEDGKAKVSDVYITQLLFQ